MNPFVQWLGYLSADADPSKAGFQASWLYILWNVGFPVLFGVTVAWITDIIAGIVRGDGRGG